MLRVARIFAVATNACEIFERVRQSILMAVESWNGKDFHLFCACNVQVCLAHRARLSKNSPLTATKACLRKLASFEFASSIPFLLVERIPCDVSTVVTITLNFIPDIPHTTLHLIINAHLTNKRSYSLEKIHSTAENCSRQQYYFIQGL
ncbi:hypothetical protein AVEN_266570-1, partial [Araneus ventricosus]